MLMQQQSCPNQPVKLEGTCKLHLHFGLYEETFLLQATICMACTTFDHYKHTLMKLKQIEICFVMLVLIRKRFAKDVWSIICVELQDKIAEEKRIQHIIAFEVLIKVL